MTDDALRAHRWDRMQRLRAHAARSGSTVRTLVWLRDELRREGLDEDAMAFAMIGILWESFELELGQARGIGVWTGLDPSGRLSDQAITDRLGPLTARVEEFEHMRPPHRP
ncbi:hypothetical protein [Kitasatospora sp. NPDC059327]|uniref:hypothetical protein n=1 Tax=Kitasatospora sp. NPDC059327 TaxID=3346803 RepID=UPI0036A5C36B